MPEINHDDLKAGIRKSRDLTGRQKLYLERMLNSYPMDPHGDFGAILNCAVRYCIGRHTYMPHLVMDYITPLLPALDDRTLYVMEKDIDECKNYGADFDAVRWAAFLHAVRQEMRKRRENTENGKV